MTQERTEQPVMLNDFRAELNASRVDEPDMRRARIFIEGAKLDPQAFADWVADGQSCHGDLIDVTAYAGREIDRLNATIADMSAKVQERDEEREKYIMQAAELRAALSNKEQHIQAHIHHKNEMVSERDKEIERLRAAMDTALTNVKVDHPDIYFVEDALTEALKGAE